MDSPTGPQGSQPAPPVAPQQPPPPPIPPDPPGVEDPLPFARGGRGAPARAGVVLILIGTALLAAQLLPGVSIWMLWPLFIIVPGLVQCFTPDQEGYSAHRFFDGLTTVAVGLIFLGNMTGYLSWGVWWQILQLWPVLIISAGLGILGTSLGQEWPRVLGSVVVLLAFAYAAMNAYAGSPVRFVGVPGGEPFAYSEPVGSVQDANLKLSAGVGEVSIDSGRNLVSIVGESPFSAPSFSKTVTGSTANVGFKLTDEGNFMVFPGATTARVDTELSDAVTWDIEVDSGVSSFDADLSGVPVRSMRLKTGVSSNRVTLGEVPVGVPEATLSIDTGVSSVKVLVPDQAMVRVESSSGLTGHRVSPGFESQGGGVWQTPGYDQAVDSASGVWTIAVKSGVGSVTIETY